MPKLCKKGKKINFFSYFVVYVKFFLYFCGAFYVHACKRASESARIYIE